MVLALARFNRLNTALKEPIEDGDAHPPSEQREDGHINIIDGLERVVAWVRSLKLGLVSAEFPRISMVPTLCSHRRAWDHRGKWPGGDLFLGNHVLVTFLFILIFN